MGTRNEIKTPPVSARNFSKPAEQIEWGHLFRNSGNASITIQFWKPHEWPHNASYFQSPICIQACRTWCRTSASILNFYN
jgi:hypothetical protein